MFGPPAATMVPHSGVQALRPSGSRATKGSVLEGVQQMKRRDFTKVVAGIAAGVVAGSKAFAADEKKPAEKPKDAKHDCKGKNECKGQGGCKTTDAG